MFVHNDNKADERTNGHHDGRMDSLRPAGWLVFYVLCSEFPWNGQLIPYGTTAFICY
jgi:hypothetical protein